jgi:hypothetical protein
MCQLPPLLAKIAEPGWLSSNLIKVAKVVPKIALNPANQTYIKPNFL